MIKNLQILWGKILLKININITTNDFKFSDPIFDERLKQAKLATNNDLNTAEKQAITNIWLKMFSQ